MSFSILIAEKNLCILCGQVCVIMYSGGMAAQLTVVLLFYHTPVILLIACVSTHYDRYFPFLSLL